MTREEFASLPPMIALGLIYDVASSRLRELPRPSVPKPPLYDGRLSRGSQGFVWMSEMLLRDLEWWAKKKRESAESGGQYADKDRKTAATLDKWIEWRTLFPSEVWSGKRGEERATAIPPQRDAPLNDWPARDGGPARGGSNKGPPPGASPENDGRDDEENNYGI